MILWQLRELANKKIILEEVQIQITTIKIFFSTMISVFFGVGFNYVAPWLIVWTVLSEYLLHTHIAGILTPNISCIQLSTEQSEFFQFRFLLVWIFFNNLDYVRVLFGYKLSFDGAKIQLWNLPKNLSI